jgi:toxin ParE1/3/4
MNLPVTRTAEAREDIIELLRYFDAQDPNLGERFLECLHETCEMIAHMPELGELYRFRNPAMKDARVRLVKKFSNYLIFYRIESDRIEILRVLHGARDYMNLFDAP